MDRSASRSRSTYSFEARSSMALERYRPIGPLADRRGGAASRTEELRAPEHLLRRGAVGGADVHGEAVGDLLDAGGDALRGERRGRHQREVVAERRVLGDVAIDHPLEPRGLE